jgi:hypothetical protein
MLVGANTVQSRRDVALPGQASLGLRAIPPRRVLLAGALLSLAFVTAISQLVSDRRQARRPRAAGDAANAKEADLGP